MNTKLLDSTCYLSICGLCSLSLFECSLVKMSDCIIVLMQAHCLTLVFPKLPKLKSLCNSINAERFCCVNNFTAKPL